MQIESLIDLPLIVTATMCPEEIEFEWQLHMERATMTSRFLSGTIDVESYLDCMCQQGFEPSELLETAQENLDFVQANHILLEA